MPLHKCPLFRLHRSVFITQSVKNYGSGTEGPDLSHLDRGKNGGEAISRPSTFQLTRQTATGRWISLD
jgi:hypothetical protein